MLTRLFGAIFSSKVPSFSAGSLFHHQMLELRGLQSLVWGNPSLSPSIYIQEVAFPHGLMRVASVR